MASNIYCFDTSALMQPWNTYYSIEFFRDFWNVIEVLARDGHIFCTDDVRREIAKKDDSLHAWVKERPFLFREPTEEVQENLRKILASHKELVKEGKDRSMADPWVIAHAMAEGATVVTKESPAPKKNQDTRRLRSIQRVLHRRHAVCAPDRPENLRNALTPRPQLRRRCQAVAPRVCRDRPRPNPTHK